MDVSGKTPFFNVYCGKIHARIQVEEGCLAWNYSHLARINLTVLKWSIPNTEIGKKRPDICEILDTYSYFMLSFVFSVTVQNNHVSRNKTSCTGPQISFFRSGRCKLQLSLYIQNKTLVTYDMFTAQKQEGIPDSVIWQSYYIPQKVPLCKGLAE